MVQAVGAFAAIFAALTVIDNNFDTLSRFAARISRLDKFVKSLELSSQATIYHLGRSHERIGFAKRRDALSKAIGIGGDPYQC